MGLLVAIFQLWGINVLHLLSRNPVRNGAQSITVFVHGKQSRSELILKNRGEVVITYGTARVRQGINEDGQAIFNEIPNRFFMTEARKKIFVNVEDTRGEPYEALNPDSQYTLIPGEPIYLKVMLAGLEKIFGTVIWNESPLGGVVVSVGTVRDTTDQLGSFILNIPEELQKQQQEVKFFKPNFKLIQKKGLSTNKRTIKHSYGERVIINNPFRHE